MKLKKLKLNQLLEEDLNNREMNSLKGGNFNFCTCSCYWADQGGSSIEANRNANYNTSGGGGSSQHGCNEYWKASCDVWTSYNTCLYGCHEYWSRP